MLTIITSITHITPDDRACTSGDVYDAPFFYVLLMFSIISLGGGGGIKMFYVFLESVIKHKIQHLHLYCNDLWVIRSMKS